MVNEGVKSLIDEVTGPLTSSIKKKYKIHKSKIKIAELVDHIANVEKVKTIWQTEKKVKVSDFYYPINTFSATKKAPTIFWIFGKNFQLIKHN